MGIPNIEDVIISLHNDFETNDKLQDKIYDLEQQLQSYKQKEDKLREYIGENTFYRDNLDNQIYVNYEHNTDRTSMVESDNILQILNEGDK